MIDTAAITTKPTLVGERIRLVPLEAHHAGALFDDLQDPEATRLTGTHATFTREQIEKWCASRADQPDRIDLAVEDLATGVFAGEVVLKDIDVDNETAGFRIALGKNFRGQGYGTEATRLVLDYAFQRIGVHRVHLEVFAFNERAKRSYEKCGFVEEGRQRDALKWDGQRYDAIVMGVLSSEYPPGD